MKLEVTAQQRANALEALHVMWPSVPPENVFPNLGWWRKSDGSKRAHCGTVACFGGWCAAWPNFVAQGVIASGSGYPLMEDDPSRDVERLLFGADYLFLTRQHDERGSDHAIVTKRLRKLIRESVVV